MAIENIKLREIELLLSLLKLKSVREVGREKNMQPGQVSKWITSLERKLGHKLLDRSATGMRPTARAIELLPYLENIASLQEKLSGETKKSQDHIFSFASSSFMSTHLMPYIVHHISETSPDVKFKLIDLPPTAFISAALRGAYEYCIHSKELEWPKTWTTEKVGNLKFNLYARKKHPVLKQPTLKNVLKYPFVIPIYWSQDGTQYGDDQCPIPMSKRIKGHETATAASAAEIVKVSDQLAFLPEIVARAPGLEEIKLPWKTIERPVYLSVKSGTVKQSDFRLISSICSDVLKSL